MEHESRISTGEFGIGVVLDGFDKDGAAVDSTITMMYLLPAWEQMGNRPVWSVKLVLCTW